MYVQKQDLDLSDFLEAVNFVTPPGYQIDYFIIPHGESFNPPEGADVSIQTPPIDDESILYHMTPPTLKKDFAQDPVEYGIWEPGELGRREPSPAAIPRVTEPEDLQSPFVKMINEGLNDKVEFVLKENIYPFPTGTYFSCERKNRIREKK
jgi:hypothetical protein